MAMTVEQYWEILQNKIRKFVLRILREEGVYNELMWPDGKIDVVGTDGKTADVFINGATVSTKAIPIANGLKVVVGDEVIVLNRAKMRDLVVMYGKTTSSLSNQSWITPTLQNAWVNFGSGYANAGYYKDSIGYVHVKGMIKSGTTTSGTSILSLPVGYRPLEAHMFGLPLLNASAVSMGSAYVDSSGNLKIDSFAGNAWVSLESINFRAEQ